MISYLTYQRQSTLFTVSVQNSETVSNGADIDEGSCICGLNREVLDKLESIIQLSSQQTCSAPASGNNNPLQSGQQSAKSEISHEGGSPSVGSSVDTHQDLHVKPEKVNQNGNPESSPKKDPSTTSTVTSSSKSETPIKTNDTEQDMLLMITKLTAEVHKLEVQLQASTKPSSSNVTASSNSGQDDPSNRDDKTSGQAADPAAESGFLAGLPANPASSHNEALMKLNQSSTVDPQEMTNALQVTIPNVVSNIFSDIKNLTSQTSDHHQESNKRDDSGKLTSIDGSSVDTKGDSSAQITADGEKLFMQWIEHQLDSLHLTVSTANYIRKNAINLFRKIAQQYVERMEKMSGRVEENVLKATQIALNNTQLLTSFLLKNYLNFAGGLMQIIGEQVSRIGRQIDSTGDTIAHMSLNPLTIVTNVLDSLPNPSTYSQYFRAFGKQLMGDESTSDSDDGKQQEQQEAPTKSTNSTNDKQEKGLIRKTMGALGKTLTSWIG